MALRAAGSFLHESTEQRVAESSRGRAKASSGKDHEGRAADPFPCGRQQNPPHANEQRIPLHATSTGVLFNGAPDM
ncbi:hypothetical protein Dimus_027229 [Dionaea muscipula]